MGDCPSTGYQGTLDSMKPDLNRGTAAPEPARVGFFEAVQVGESGVPFRICWGDHAERCDVDPRGMEAGHGPVAQIDYDNADHRRVLRWMRRLAADHSLPFAVPHPATLVRRPVPVTTEITKSLIEEEKS
jgi:hypothetical protein